MAPLGRLLALTAVGAALVVGHDGGSTAGSKRRLGDAEAMERNLLALPLAKRDIDTLKLAFALECLQAQFLSYAATGGPLPDDVTGGGPAPEGGKNASLSPSIRARCEEMADENGAQIALLQKILTRVTGAPQACPYVSIGKGFSETMNMALETKLDPPFSPYDTDSGFLLGAHMLGEVVTGAYAGFLGAIKDPELTDAFAGILATEAYQAGNVRSVLFEKDATQGVLLPYRYRRAAARMADTGTVVNALAALRSKLARGAMGKPQEIGVRHVAPANANGLVFRPAFKDALSVLQLGAANRPAGFYPNDIFAVLNL
ncbi:ferritin-like domain-containing protein [Tribonema minus]|uniref:Ferritin-like domain-containing protein n=1 Tax=Tribonema minus TaxID=303371 RepID=A0A835YUF8_9STRA|nr:ferritin-like domain-containing protein [Tribonema minus]